MRLCVYLLWPICILVFLGWAFSSSWDKANYPVLLKLIFAILILSVFTIPYTVLTINHWNYSIKQELTMMDGKFIYKLGNDIFEFTNNDVQSILEFYTVSRIYGTFSYWKMNVRNREIIFSSMFISKSIFKKLFGTKIESKIIAWPIILQQPTKVFGKAGQTEEQLAVNR